MKKFIYAKCQVEGLHRWKDADNYLVSQHRHMFHIKAKIQVFDNDREIEFIEVKHEIIEFLGKWLEKKSCHNFKNMSCEDIALEIGKELRDIHGIDREYIVDVSEDNENGAIIEIMPTDTFRHENVKFEQVGFEPIFSSTSPTMVDNLIEGGVLIDA